MALNYLLSQRTPGKIDTLELDATISEGHEYSNEVTDFPIEEGSDISDHVRRSPERVTLEGFVTNTPVKYFGEDSSVRNSLNEIDGSRVESAFGQLLDIAGYDLPGTTRDAYNGRGAKIITLVTGLRSYFNMVLVSLSIPRNAQTGETLRFTAEFKKISQVKPEYTLVQNTSELNGKAPNIKNQAQKTADKSKQNTSTASTEKADTVSLLRSILGKLSS